MIRAPLQGFRRRIFIGQPGVVCRRLRFHGEQRFLHPGKAIAQASERRAIAKIDQLKLTQEH
jgi:hypothetical protein